MWHDASVSGDRSPSWQNAIGGADFVPFEPVGDQVDAIWAGGFGGLPGFIHDLEICGLSGGLEISVETTTAPQQHPDSNVRLSLFVDHLISTHVLGNHAIELPFALTVAGDDRQISVSGSEVRFSGARTRRPSSGWAKQ